MGHYFCDTILDFCDPDQSKVNAIRAGALPSIGDIYDAGVIPVWSRRRLCDALCPAAELEMMYPPKKDRNKPKPVDDDSGDTCAAVETRRFLSAD